MSDVRMVGGRVLCAALIMCLLSGCVSRSIIAIEDHPDKDVAMMKIASWKTAPVVGAQYSQAQEFWLCKEQGDTYRCTRTCDSHAAVLLWRRGDHVPGGGQHVLNRGQQPLQAVGARIGAHDACGPGPHARACPR